MLGLIDRPGELTVDDLLGTLQTRVRVELLIDNFASFFQRHDFRRRDLQFLDTLGDRGFADTEMLGGGGLRVAGVEVDLETGGVRVDLGSGHWLKV